MPVRTGTSRRPDRRTVATVKRSPTCRPISANAVSRSAGGTAKSRPRAGERQRAREDHRPEQHRRRAGGPGATSTAGAAGGAAVHSQPVAVAERRRVRRRGGGARHGGVVRRGTGSG